MSNQAKLSTSPIWSSSSDIKCATRKLAAPAADNSLLSPVSHHTEETSTNMLLNTSELLADWSDVAAVASGELNHDPSPEVVVKPNDQVLEYTQEVIIRYLRPPTPPEPGEIVIEEQRAEAPPPAPPIIIRQFPEVPRTPEPIVIREAPPPRPPPVPPRVIKVPGKKLPPAPRRVIVERFAPMPPRPQAVLIERWLPYTPQKRRVILKR